MDKFISIAVNQGDAFYLERAGHNILVDGGRARQGFPSQFERVTGSSTIHYMVCSHADSDHINGLLGLLEQGISISEIWLPGAWTSRLEDLILKPREFVIQLYDELQTLNIEAEDSLDNLHEKLESTHSHIDSSGHNISKIYSAIETREIDNEIEIAFNTLYVEIFLGYEESRSSNILLDALKTAKNIRKLAILAYHSGAKIRWFEFGKTPTDTCGNDYLKPINAREIFSISKYRTALNFASLSKANKESLVFYSPSNNNKTDVLFNADSDLAFACELPQIGKSSIVTAPHHGSESNKKAYSRLQREAVISKETILVRSDGKYKSRPGKSYLNSEAKKVCTLCRPFSDIKQNIILEASNNEWVFSDNLRLCKCK